MDAVFYSRINIKYHASFNKVYLLTYDTHNNQLLLDISLNCCEVGREPLNKFQNNFIFHFVNYLLSLYLVRSVEAPIHTALT
jgi:hypothetical protein